MARQTTGEHDFTTPFHLDGWIILPRQHRIESGDTVHPVEPKVMKVLVCLARRAPQPVSRRELFEEVWEGNFVSEDVLSRCISILRNIFGDDPRNPSVIDTIPKHGYALMVEPVFGNRPAAHGTNGAGAKRPARRYAGALAGAVTLLLLVAAILIIPDASPDQASQTTLTPVTSLVGRELSPDVSPEDDRVVFLVNSEENPQTDLYVSEISGNGSPTRLTESEASEMSPVWSPDGNQIAFLRYSPDGECGIYTISQWGDDERFVTNCKNELFSRLSWSADNILAYSYTEEEDGFGVPAIYGFSLDNGERRRLTHPPEEVFGDYHPRFISGGEQLVFQRSIREGRGALLSLSMESGSFDTLLSEDRMRLGGYDWLEQEGSLILSANRANGYGIWKYAPRSRTFSTLIPGRNLYNPVVVEEHPSTRILYEEWELQTGIYRAALRPDSGKRADPLVASSRMDVLPSPSAGHGKIAFLTDRSGTLQLWMAEGDGSDPRPINTDNVQPMPHKPFWSHDGERLVFTGLVEGTSQIFLADLFTGRVIQLTGGMEDKISPSWSHDDEFIYFGEHDSGQWNVARIAPGTGRTETVVEGRNACIARESPDGDRLYFTTCPGDGIYAVSLSPDEVPEKLKGVMPASDHAQDWQVTRRGIYYIGTEGGQRSLFRWDSGSGRIERLYRFEDRPVGPGLAVSEIEGSFYFVKVERSSSDLVIMTSTM